VSAPKNGVALVVMGPSGCGKSTLAAALAEALDWEFVEGDRLHSTSNIAKMQRGAPLTDEDRAPWLDRIGEALARESATGVVAACSALKRSYRDRLRNAAGDLFFILPELPRETLEARLWYRKGHYMPVSLLDSQIRTLEMPEADEMALCLDGNLPVEAQVRQVLSALGRG